MTANDSQVRQAGTSTTAKLADELSEASIASRGFLDRLRPGFIRARPYYVTTYRTREDLLATVRVVAIWAPKHSMGDLGSYEPAIKG